MDGGLPLLDVEDLADTAKLGVIEGLKSCRAEAEGGGEGR